MNMRLGFFDRAPVSSRSYDLDGRLTCRMARISKANVCPYKGNEIPGWEELGLEKDKIYQLLRDPDELRKAAPTFCGLPLMIRHVPVDAEDHPHELVCGCLGTDCEFDGVFLRCSLTVWDGHAISRIESGDAREISCGYRYSLPEMVPGVFQGEHFDGRMVDLVGNHVALVEEGRAGTDCSL